MALVLPSFGTDLARWDTRNLHQTKAASTACSGAVQLVALGAVLSHVLTLKNRSFDSRTTTPRPASATPGAPGVYAARNPKSSSTPRYGWDKNQYSSHRVPDNLTRTTQSPAPRHRHLVPHPPQTQMKASGLAGPSLGRLLLARILLARILLARRLPARPLLPLQRSCGAHVGAVPSLGWRGQTCAEYNAVHLARSETDLIETHHSCSQHARELSCAQTHQRERTGTTAARTYRFQDTAGTGGCRCGCPRCAIVTA